MPCTLLFMTPNTMQMLGSCSAVLFRKEDKRTAWASHVPAWLSSTTTFSLRLLCVSWGRPGAHRVSSTGPFSSLSVGSKRGLTVLCTFTHSYQLAQEKVMTKTGLCCEQLVQDTAGCLLWANWFRVQDLNYKNKANCYKKREHLTTSHLVSLHIEK